MLHTDIADAHQARVWLTVHTSMTYYSCAEASDYFDVSKCTYTMFSISYIFAVILYFCNKSLIILVFLRPKICARPVNTLAPARLSGRLLYFYWNHVFLWTNSGFNVLVKTIFFYKETVKNLTGSNDSIWAALRERVPNVLSRQKKKKRKDKWKRLSVDTPPASCPPCHYFCPKDLLTLIGTSRDVTAVWHDMLCHNKVDCTLIFTFYMPRKSRFFDLVTLAFDLWPWVSNSSEILSRYTPPPIFVSVCQTVWPWECSQTDGRDRKHYFDRFRGR